ncbi:MAG TPA: penicillin-binding protein 2, partial [Rhodothermales bacterium]
MDEYRIRVRIFSVIIVVLLSIIGMRLGHLQLVESEQYRGESRSNAVREIRVQPARGAIYDRNGVRMVDNAQMFTITLTPYYFDESNVELLAELLEVSDSTVQAKLKQARDFSPFQPSRSFREVPFAIYSRVMEKSYLLPGVGFEVEQKRRFVTDAQAAHAVGYIREINRSMLERRRRAGYQQGDLVGQTGLEKRYEDYLRGKMGSEFKFVDTRGRIIDAYDEGKGDIAPVSGYDMYTTIDHRVQALAESLFVGKRGGVVALDPKTGGIIALVSAPDYDPQIFTESIDPKTWAYLNSSRAKPLYNRATQGAAVPGSTWKPFMALMALDAGHIKPGERYNCPGGHPFGNGVRFRCMGVHGSLDVEGAIQNSCNTFFFEMMRRSNPDEFARYAHMFGFGENAPIEIDEQIPGLIPDSSYYNRMYPAGWTLGYWINLGIGQGDMYVTPMQLARYVMAVANKGTLYAPYLVERLVNPETHEVIYPAKPAPRHIPIREEHFDIVRNGMRRVMEAGTGRLMQLEGIPSGGKTGTAQHMGH